MNSPQKRQRIRWHSRQRPTPPASLPGTSKLDVALARIANLSQLGLLLLAVFGYVYTVLPVYQKALLDEEISKRTLELNAKDMLLQAKTAELQTLSAAAARAQTDLRRARHDVNKLQGAVQTQYQELQPRLLQEFQLLAGKLCRLTVVPNDGFSACVRENVLPTVNLAPLSEGDRRRLQHLVDARNGEIHRSWKEYRDNMTVLRAEAQRKMEDVNQRCEASKKTDEYKDRIKRISIDHECESQRIRAKSELLQIDMRDAFQEEGFIHNELIGIVQAFYRGDQKQ